MANVNAKGAKGTNGRTSEWRPNFASKGSEGLLLNSLNTASFRLRTRVVNTNTTKPWLISTVAA